MRLNLTNRLSSESISARRRLMVKVSVIFFSILFWFPYLSSTPFNPFQPASYSQEGGLFPWIILLSNLIWLFSRRSRVLIDLKKPNFLFKNTTHLCLGAVSCFLSLVFAQFVGLSLPRRIFPTLLFTSGLASILGTLLPLILSIIYGLGVFIPILIKEFAETSYSQASVQAFTFILKLLGYPVRSEGSVVYLSTSSNGTISMYVDSICAGSSSLTVFATLFILMCLDLELKLEKRVVIFFTVGCVGTYMQAILRLIVISLIAFQYGVNALMKAHLYVGYIIFFIYFTVFTYFYLKAIKERRNEQR